MNTTLNKMDIYSKKQKWKFTLLGFAIIIGVSSIFVTNSLVSELKSEERKKIGLWAEATKSVNGEGEINPFMLRVISENNNIPVILVDAGDSILENRNFQNFSKLDSLFFSLGIRSPQKVDNKFLRTNLNKIKENGYEPIDINIIGDKQWIYYTDSALLNRLRYYPIYQLGFIGLFIFIAYFIFSASRKSEQNKVWAGMAKETAHQIATPLSSLMAWIELLKDKDETESIVFEMEKDITRLETITDRFSKIGSKPTLEEKNIVELVVDTITYLKSRLPEKIQFNILHEKSEIIIPVSTVLLNWVIENVCKNAADAMKGKGEIKISITEDASKVILNITDNGEGVERSILKNIFKPGVTSKKRGWGLGLSLSKRIVEEYHKGRIFVMKSEKGVGTTFCIHLPKKLNSTAS